MRVLYEVCYIPAATIPKAYTEDPGFLPCTLECECFMLFVDNVSALLHIKNICSPSVESCSSYIGSAWKTD